MVANNSKSVNAVGHAKDCDPAGRPKNGTGCAKDCDHVTDAADRAKDGTGREKDCAAASDGHIIKGGGGCWREDQDWRGAQARGAQGGGKW